MTGSHSHSAEDHKRGVPSTAAIHGHPLHPALVALPIAFLVGAAVTDVLYWRSTGVLWAHMSFWLLVAGTASGALAAVAGLIDFTTIARARVHRVGWVHAVGNGFVLALAAANAMQRISSTTDAIVPVGLTLSLMTAALLGVTGWCGGELVFRHMIGVIGHGSRGGNGGTDSGSMKKTTHRFM